MWFILFGVLALAIGVLIAITTGSYEVSEAEAGDPWITFEFTVVWPSGPVTYCWSIGKVR